MPVHRILPRLLTAAATVVVLGAASCQPSTSPASPGAPGASAGGPSAPPPETAAATTLGRKAPLAPVAAEPAPEPAPRVTSPLLADVDARVASYFAGLESRRLYVQVDKPLYQPGETIWLRAWDLRAKDLSVVGDGPALYELVSPRGSVVLKQRVPTTAGYSTNDFALPPDIPGGEYTIRIHSPDGRVTGERPVIVSRYEAPRMKKKLEFLRKAYGPGDVVSATFDLRRPTGEPMARHPVTALLRLDGSELPRVTTTTNEQGSVVVKVPLPPTIAVGDGLLTILVDDGGITESVSKAVPIVMKRMDLAFFPEGGRLVAGVPSRVYFEAKTPLGKPADVAGEIVDDQGQVVARFESHKAGLGRFSFVPARGRSYVARVSKPEGIIDSAQLPVAADDGCVLRTFDDLDGVLDVLRAGVTCTTDQTVVVVAVQRDQLLDKAAVAVTAGKQAVVALAPVEEARKDAMGVARVTVFDEKKNPLAERIVFRNRRARLAVDVKPQKERFAPRDQVALTVTTRGRDGKPVPAELALAVVDDTVVSFADDKTGHLLSRVYLEPELPGVVEEPNLFFDLADDTSALALELLMGTRGWRTFEWRPVLDPPPPPVPEASGAQILAFDGDGDRFAGGGAAPRGIGGLEKKGGAPRRMGRAAAPGIALEGEGGEEGEVEGVAAAALAPENARAMPRAARAPAAATPPMVPAMVPRGPAQLDEVAAKPIAAGARAAAPAPMPVFANEAVGKAALAAADRAEAAPFRERKMDIAADAEEAVALAPVRVFPAPVYGGTATPPVRDDFRETIHWAPQVKTGVDGTAIVTFYLSDAVTSFRVFTEGVGGGRAGRDEAVIESKLPFSMAVKLPLEVSAGDHVTVPLSLTNETDENLDVDVQASFGDLVKAADGSGGTKTLAKGARTSKFYELDVTGISGTSKVSFAAAGAGLKDEFNRSLVVVPRGFPVERAYAGTVKDKASHDVDVGDAAPGTIEASVRVYPSPTATLLSGLEGMLREPNGCFEQTSSTNYPNIMILTYLERNGVAAPAVQERAQKLLDSGYKKLVGFETPEKGYEWFGGAPGHEALSAYGLLEFNDMKAVYGDVDSAMVARTAQWLLGRRDGKGGYQRNERALDSFGGAPPDVTNAYITYALSEARQRGIETEIAAEATRAASTNDPYLLALATNTLFNAGRTAEGEAAARRLVGLQEESGAWTKAATSITRSGGESLQLETTSLAVLALLKTESRFPEPTRRAVEWLMAHRGSFGQWGATQSTVLTLKALVAYLEATKRTQGPGTLIVQVNGKVVRSVNYDAGHHDPIVVDGLGTTMTTGRNEVKLLVDGKDALPYSLGVRFRASQPPSSPDATIDVAVALDKTTAKMGEPVRAEVVVRNKTAEGQPMTLVRVGIPGGLASQDWQLKKLREDTKIAFFETGAREVILYFRDLKPSEEKRIPIDLVAQVPGRYEAPATSAYLYYTAEKKSFAAPLRVEIVP
jgi:hypothetical protein